MNPDEYKACVRVLDMLELEGRAMADHGFEHDTVLLGLLREWVQDRTRGETE